MRILSKKSVDIQVAAQKKVQIDESVALSKKIDLLRQTLSSLELQHSKFKAGMVSELKRETDHLMDRVASLKIEISDLEAKRRLLLEPLNQAWEDARLKSKEILTLQSEIDQKKSALDFKEKKSQEREEKSKDSLSRIKIRERELDRAYERALELKDEAELIKSSTYTQKEIEEKEIESLKSSLLDKERKILNDLSANEHLRELLDAKEKELIQKERAVNDKYETLLRSIERLKK